MSKLKYIRHDNASLDYLREGRLKIEEIERAVHAAHEIIDRIAELKASHNIDIFETLGMRNLSGFIGEVFAASMIKSTNNLFIKNPHQDGYPDLLLLDTDGIKLYNSLNNRLREKKPFSPFETGGIEIKATCGSTPTPEMLAKRGLTKPAIGDSRISVLNTMDWKSHHRDTNFLLGIMWDFIDSLPRIVGVFYSNELTQDDWRKIVQPKVGGGKTTSVSPMEKRGVEKMVRNCLLLIDDARYANFLEKYGYTSTARKTTVVESLF